MAVGEPFAVGVTDPSAAAEARRQATALAATLGFDEADALFGRRTEVRDAHDRDATRAADDPL